MSRMMIGLTSSPSRSDQRHQRKKKLSDLKLETKSGEATKKKNSESTLNSQSPILFESLLLRGRTDTFSSPQNKKDRRLIPPCRNVAVNNQKIQGIQSMWEKRANRWSVSKQYILDQEDIVYYNMISPPLMETLNPSYTGEFALALTRNLQLEKSTVCVTNQPKEDGGQPFARSFWSLLNDLGPKYFYFSQICTCHSLWNTFANGKMWKCIKLDLLPRAFRKNTQQTRPPLRVHTKHFEVHRPFGFSLDPLESDAILKTVTLDDVGCDDEGQEDTLVCMQEVFLFLFFNQFLLTPRFLRCAWRPLYGEISLMTEQYDGDLTVFPRTMLRYLPKQEILADMSQEILFLVRSLSLLGWLCFDLKPQNMVFRWHTPGKNSTSQRNRLSVKLIDFDARYYASAHLPFSVLFWCNLYALCLNFEGVHRWKSRHCGNFWWWEEGVATLLLKVLKPDLSVGLRTCSILWTHLAVVEQKNPNQFIDPFYVTWYYCKKEKHIFSSREELYVQITAFIYSQWTAIADTYLNTIN